MYRKDVYIGPAPCRNLAERVRNLPNEVRFRVYRTSARAEHIGFVGIAVIDVFHIHGALFGVSVVLLISGLFMEFFHVGGAE